MSLEVAENKEWKLEKESQERQRGCKLLKTLNESRGEKRNTEGTEVGGQRSQRGTPRGNSDGYQNKGLAGKAIRKVVKTKGQQKAT
jgi:hypothetical protein